MIKWCAAFCDEGEAAWPMPGREDDRWQSCTLAAAEIVTDPDAAFHRALELAGEQGVVVVTGSIHLAGCVRPFVRVRQTMTDQAGVTLKKFA